MRDGWRLRQAALLIAWGAAVAAWAAAAVAMLTVVGTLVTMDVRSESVERADLARDARVCAYTEGCDVAAAEAAYQAALDARQARKALHYERAALAGTAGVGAAVVAAVGMWAAREEVRA